jgi:predicted small lipoprotein YifL
MIVFYRASAMLKETRRPTFAKDGSNTSNTTDGVVGPTSVRRRPMRLVNGTIISLAALALLAGCGHKTPTSLSGKYGPPNAPAAMEFHSDGTVTLTAPMGSIKTSYTIKDGKVTVAEPGGGTDTLTLNIDDKGCLYAEGHESDTKHRLCPQ